MKRDMNKARTICSISPQSSLYTPIIDPPSRLPSTIYLNPQSQWYTSALISSAMETVTLPTRLRPYHDFESSLAGDDSIHKIFELQSSIFRTTNDEKHSSRRTGPNDSSDSKGDETSKVQTKFDLDFSYDSLDSNTSHIFNQLQVRRGFEDAEYSVPSMKDLGLLRKERAFNSEPNFQR